MASIDGKESATDLTNSSDNVNLYLQENSGTDNLYKTNCVSCEGCKLTEDCGSCENCVLNYIEMNIKHVKSPELLPCLKKMCISMKTNFHLETGLVVPLSNETDQLKIKSIKTKTTNSDETGGKPENCIKLEEELGFVLQEEEAVSRIKRKKTMTTEGTKLDSDEEGFKKVILMDYGSCSLKNITDNSESDNFLNSESTEMCGSCAGCTTNCRKCWNCLDRDMVASKETESRIICENRKCNVNKQGTGSKVRVIKKGEDEVNIKTVTLRRKRCGTCPGCTKLENCKTCYPCIKGKVSKSICKERKCHYLKKKASPGCNVKIFDHEKNEDKGHNKTFGPENKIETRVKTGEENLKRTKRCGECEGCRAPECGYCQGCQINQYFARELLIGEVPCLKNSCKDPIELSSDMDLASLMAQQDDSSSGWVCPVKISNGILYDFRCFFCKKLPRVGSANRSELMRHYSISHYADELRLEFSHLKNGEHCLLCDVKLNTSNVPSHFGQKHNSVIKYLPPEATALIDGIQLKTEVQCYPTEDFSIQEVDSPQISESFKDPSDVDQLSSDKDWKANFRGESSEGMGSNSEAMNVWIEENDSNEDHEVVPLGDTCNSSLDLSGFSGRCSICTKEFSQVQMTAEHLHKEHDIMGGFTDIIEDCQKFIEGGYIRLMQKQHETHNTSSFDYKSCLAFETYLMAESKRYATQNSTNQAGSKMNKNNSNNESSQRNAFMSPWIFNK